MLVIGGELGAADLREFESEGFVLVRVEDTAEGLSAMIERRFAAVLVAPTFSTEGDGVSFVRMIVHNSTDLTGADGALGDRYDRVPFLILPLAGEDEFAYVDVSGACSLLRRRDVSIAATVTHLLRRVPTTVN